MAALKTQARPVRANNSPTTSCAIPRASWCWNPVRARWCGSWRAHRARWRRRAGHQLRHRRTSGALAADRKTPRLELAAGGAARLRTHRSATAPRARRGRHQGQTAQQKRQTARRCRPGSRHIRYGGPPKRLTAAQAASCFRRKNDQTPNAIRGPSALPPGTHSASKSSGSASPVSPGARGLRTPGLARIST